jgi:hypothetical protein
MRELGINVTLSADGSEPTIYTTADLDEGLAKRVGVWQEPADDDED